MKKLSRPYLIVISLAVAALLVFYLVQRDPAPTELTFSELEQKIEDGEIVEATILDRSHAVEGELADGEQFTATFPAEATDELFSELRAAEPAIELVDAGGETRRLALPIEETDLDGSDHEGWVFPRIRASDDQILLVAGTTTWSVDIRTGDWTKLADLPEPQTEFVEYDFASSEQLVGVSDDDIVVADLVGGTVETFEITNDLGPWARMLYADSDLFLLETEDGIVAVDLPQ